MAIKSLTAFGMTVNVDESTLEEGCRLAEQLRIQNATPTDCINAIARELKLTGAEAVAVYSEYANRRKPLF